MKEFSIFVEAMRRLYKDGNVTKEKIVGLFECNKITEDEKKYILGA